jgi:hypothetical protein
MAHKNAFKYTWLVWFITLNQNKQNTITQFSNVTKHSASVLQPTRLQLLALKDSYKKAKAILGYYLQRSEYCTTFMYYHQFTPQ